MRKADHETIVAAGSTEETEGIATPRQLYDFFAARLPPPGRITGLNLFCEGTHSDRILCLIDLADISAVAAAKALEGHPFAFSSVFLSIAVNEKFSCRVRQNGKRPEGSCSCGNGPTTITGSILDRD